MTGDEHIPTRWAGNTIYLHNIKMNIRMGTHSNQVGRQYIEDTSEVQEAKARFFKFFQFAVDGLLYK